MNQMQMFGGFGSGGMGMNDMSGMNMGMGFGGNFGGNWNGQTGMGGNFGAGYYPNAGYNQQQMHQGAYGNQMHNQQFQNHNYQNRFQGHRGGGYARGGRGGFGGRGGHHVNNFQGQQQAQAQAQGQYGIENTSFAQQLPDGDQGDGRPAQATEQSSGNPDDQSAMPVDENNPQLATGQDVAINESSTNIEGQVPQENGDVDMYQAGDGVQMENGMDQGPSFGGKPHYELVCFTHVQCSPPKLRRQLREDEHGWNGPRHVPAIPYGSLSSRCLSRGKQLPGWLSLPRPRRLQRSWSRSWWLWEHVQPICRKRRQFHCRCCRG